MTICLRPARLDDAPAIAAILSDWIDETPWIPRVHTRQEDQLFGAFLIERTMVTVAALIDRPNVICGFAALQPPQIQALYLAPRWRGQGVGTRLLNHLKSQCQPLQLWAFQANDGAQRFYEREGFVEVERTNGAENDEKLPDIRMVWEQENRNGH